MGPWLNSGPRWRVSWPEGTECRPYPCPGGYIEPIWRADGVHRREIGQPARLCVHEAAHTVLRFALGRHCGPTVVRTKYRPGTNGIYALGCGVSLPWVPPDTPIPDFDAPRDAGPCQTPALPSKATASSWLKYGPGELVALRQLSHRRLFTYRFQGDLRL
jgi:hypothetical protein